MVRGTVSDHDVADVIESTTPPHEYSATLSFPVPSPSIVIPIVAGIGNALLAVPMVRQMKAKLPGARITILARINAMAEVFRRLREVDEVLVTGKGAAGLLNLVRAARQRRADYYVVPFPSNRWQYSMLAITSGAKKRVLHGYGQGYWRALHFLPATRVIAIRGIHDVEQNLNLLEPLGIVPDRTDRPTFEIKGADRAQAGKLLRAAGVAGDVRPIVIHAGSARTVLALAKRWPASSYAALIGPLGREFGNRIVLLEGPDEAGVADEILRALRESPAGSAGPAPSVLRLTGSLADAAAILERAELYVGSDSGLAHLAAAVGTSPVTLFAPADPDRVAPFGHRDLVVQAPVPCSPCFQYPWRTTYPKICCRAPYCIATITVDMVLARVRRAIADKPNPSTRLSPVTLFPSPDTPGES